MRIQIPLVITGDTKGAQAASAALKGVGAQAKKVEVAFADVAKIAAASGLAIAGAATAMAAGFVSAASRAASFNDRIADLATSTGLGVGNLEKLGPAAALAGVDLDTIAGSMNKLQKAIVEGDSVFGRLGLSLEQLRQQAPEQQFAAIAGQIAKIQDPAQRAAAAMEVFGKSGAELLPLLTSNLKDLFAQSVTVSDVLGGKMVAASAQLDDQLAALGSSWQTLVNVIGTVVSANPALQGGITSTTQALVELTKWVGQNRNEISAWVTGGVAGAAQAMAGLVSVVEVGMAAFKALADIWTVLRGAGELLAAQAVLWGKSLASGGILAASAWEDYRKTFDATTASVKTGLADNAAALAGAIGVTTKVKEAFEDVASSAATMGGAVASATETAGRGLTFLSAGAVKASAAMKTLAADVAAAFAEAQKKAGGFMLSPLPEPPKITPDPAHDWAATLYENGIRIKTTQDEIAKSTQKTLEVTTDWNRVLQDTSNLFNVLGIDAESALGRILGGITGVMSSLQSLAKSGIKSFGDFFKSLSGGAGFGGFATALVGGLSIGASVFSMVKGIFSKPEFAKVMEDVGRDWGVAISEGLAKEIEETMNSLDLGRFEAALLHTSDIIEESGRDAREFTEQIGDLFNAVAMGAVPMAEGLTEIGEAFNLVADAAMKAGSVGDQALVGMIRRARELGLVVPEIEAFVKEALSAAAAGVGAAFGEGGIKIVTPEDARAQATIFSATFWATVSESGLIAAADAMKPAFESMIEQLKGLGIDPTTIFGDVMGAMNLADNELFRGAAEGAQGLKQALEGLANSGYLTADSFAAFGQQAQSAFNQAVAGGANQTQALQAILPLLASMQSAAANYGFTLDAGTQALIDQAEAAGLAFPTDPVTLLTNAIKDLSDAIRGVPSTIDVHTNYTSSGAPPGGGGPKPPPGTDGVPEYAGGGVMQRTGYAYLHGTPSAPEYIFTSDQLKAMGRMFTPPAPALAAPATSFVPRPGPSGGFGGGMQRGPVQGGNVSVNYGGNTFVAPPGADAKKFGREAAEEFNRAMRRREAVTRETFKRAMKEAGA